MLVLHSVSTHCALLSSLDVFFATQDNFGWLSAEAESKILAGPGCIDLNCGASLRKLRELLGGIVAGGVLYLIASGKPGFELAAGFASNGYGAHSPGGYSMEAALITEIVMTMMFLVIILGATDKRAPQGFAPIAIGLCLTLIHLISIPVTNTSVNPARSTGVALYVGDWATAQLWLFWVAPIIGGILGAVVYRIIGKQDNS